MDTPSTSERMSIVRSAYSSCSRLTTTQSNQLTAASVAMQLLRLAAPQDTSGTPAAAWSILASQRYIVQSSGTGIEFNPKDNLYLGGWVTSEMQAVLAIPQEQDP